MINRCLQQYFLRELPISKIIMHDYWAALIAKVFGKIGFVNDIPGPISRDTDQLIKDIKEYNEDSWKEKYKNYHDKFNGIDDGHASQKVIDVIKKVSR